MQVHTLSPSISSKNPKRLQRGTSKSLKASKRISSTKSLDSQERTERQVLDTFPPDKTVYETAGIVDRLDRLKAKVETELVKEGNKSRWFSECQRTIEEKKKIQKSKQDHFEFWTLADSSHSSATSIFNNSYNNSYNNTNYNTTYNTNNTNQSGDTINTNNTILSDSNAGNDTKNVINIKSSSSNLRNSNDNNTNNTNTNTTNDSNNTNANTNSTNTNTNTTNTANNNNNNNKKSLSSVDKSGDGNGSESGSDVEVI